MTVPALHRSEPMNLLVRLSPLAAKRAATEAVTRMVCGVNTVPEPHPAVADLEAGRLEDRSLQTLVECLDPESAAGRKHWTRSNILNDLIGPALIGLQRQYPIPAHRSFVAVVPAPDYRPFRVVNGAHGIRMRPTSEAGELPNSLLTDLEWEPCQIVGYSAIAQLSKEEMQDDRDLGVFKRLSEAMLSAAFRHEQAEVFRVLTSDPTLRDSAPWFDESNSTSGATLDWSAIDGLCHLLAGQTGGNGGYLGLEPATILLPSDPTVSAGLKASDIPATLLAAVNQQQLRIVRSPSLTDQAFVLADAQSAPSIALAVLNPEPVIETRNKLPINLPGVGLEMSVRNSFAVVPVSRRGIARFSITG